MENKWTYTRAKKPEAYLKLGKESKGVIWSVDDARKICKILNNAYKEGYFDGSDDAIDAMDCTDESDPRSDN